jgi:NAD dependent epimerase/dehydratase family enzyme
MEIVPAVSRRPLRIVLPGGSGQVGQVLARHFQERGHHVTVLTRGPYTAPWQTVHWDGEERGPWIETLEGADVCINLAGTAATMRSTGLRFTTRAFTPRNCSMM